MKLKISDRLLILSVLPQEGNIMQVRLVRDLIGKIGLSAKEIEDWKVKSEKNGQIKWDNSKAIEKEIPISESESKIIADTFEEISKNNKLNVSQIELYDTFCKKGGE